MPNIVTNHIVSSNTLSNMTLDELKNLKERVNSVIEAKGQQQKWTFRPGDRAYFETQRRGLGRVEVVVDKINISKAVCYPVDAAGERIPHARGWNVPFTILRKSEDVRVTA